MWELIFVGILLGYIIYQHNEIKRLNKELNKKLKWDQEHDMEI
jgi:hypothetical protein